MKNAIAGTRVVLVKLKPDVPQHLLGVAGYVIEGTPTDDLHYNDSTTIKVKFDCHETREVPLVCLMELKASDLSYEVKNLHERLRAAERELEKQSTKAENQWPAVGGIYWYLDVGLNTVQQREWRASGNDLALREVGNVHRTALQATAFHSFLKARATLMRAAEVENRVAWTQRQRYCAAIPQEVNDKAVIEPFLTFSSVGAARSFSEKYLDPLKIYVTGGNTDA